MIQNYTFNSKTSNFCKYFSHNMTEMSANNCMHLKNYFDKLVNDWLLRICILIDLVCPSGRPFLFFLPAKPPIFAEK
jgi:hypothetical protein